MLKVLFIIYMVIINRSFVITPMDVMKAKGINLMSFLKTSSRNVKERHNTNVLPNPRMDNGVMFDATYSQIMDWIYRPYRINELAFSRVAVYRQSIMQIITNGYIVSIDDRERLSDNINFSANFTRKDARDELLRALIWQL